MIKPVAMEPAGDAELALRFGDRSRGLEAGSLVREAA
jgi:hypothetical protein